VLDRPADCFPDLVDVVERPAGGQAAYQVDDALGRVALDDEGR
jgi:hypothetical protein